MSPSDEKPTPLPLQVDIPKEHLPDVLDVYDKHALALLNIPIPLMTAEQRNWVKFLARHPVKFVRKLPVRVTPKDKEMRCTIGQLDLSQGQSLGPSNHSYVFLAPLTVPSRARPSLRGQVAVKMAMARGEDRRMLKDEAWIYDMFPRELQQGTPSSPPVVPKFFGYYIPSCVTVDRYKGKDGDEEDAEMVRRDVRKLLKKTIGPILLLEPCGQPIKAYNLSGDNKNTIVGLFDRLHNARFIQGSVYQRNILVQPGPLTLPRAERSIDNPSYRLIDFGRGECYDWVKSSFADEKIEDERRHVRSRVSRGLL